MGGDVFVWVMVGVFVLLLAFIILLGIFYPGTGADQLDWKPTRSPELEAQNEIDDLDQMLRATNDKRRARGLDPLTENAVNARVHEDRRLRESLREKAAPAEDAELEEERRQLAEAREARRRRREAEGRG